MKKIAFLSVGLSLVILFSQTQFVCASDITPLNTEGDAICEPCSVSQYKSASNWAVQTLQKANAASIIPARLQGNYKSLITREEFASLIVSLYETLHNEEATILLENPFIDSFNLDVLKAYHLGFMNGTSEKEFSPNNFITREEISVILARFIQKESQLDLNQIDVSDLQGFYLDEPSFAEWSKDSILKLTKINLMKGIAPNKFGAKNETTIEQAVVFVFRIYELISSETTIQE